MTAEERLRLRLTASLLRYPDAEMVSDLPDLATCIGDIADPAARENLAAFLACLAETPLIRLQEHYTAAFDTCPDTCLNLTYHLMGDHEDRGKALARIQEIFLCGGYGPAVADLPDFLPMVLEFLAVCPDAPGAGFLWHCLTPTQDLARKLTEAGNPYRFVLGILPDASGV